MGVKLSAAQRRTLLRYVELPTSLAERLSAQGAGETVTFFTLDELDDLLDRLEIAICRAKGNEKQKVQRMVQKVAGLLGSEIDPGDLSGHRPSNKSALIYQIKMTLRGIGSPIWRRIQTKDCTLEQLHTLIQVAMGWGFEHSYEFRIGAKSYLAPDLLGDEDDEDASATRLSDVLPVQNRRPRFEYMYDFGDEWRHQLIVEERLPPEAGVKYPRCLAGARACPPENCGGRWGYDLILEALKDPEQNQERLEWLGGEFDPEKFDLERVNQELSRLK
jgi:hypothetical protein